MKDDVVSVWLKGYLVGLRINPSGLCYQDWDQLQPLLIQSTKLLEWQQTGSWTVLPGPGPAATFAKTVD